jgi:hypothetical protein
MSQLLTPSISFIGQVWRRGDTECIVWIGLKGRGDTKRCASTSSLKNIVLKFCSVLCARVLSVDTTIFIVSHIFTYKFKLCRAWYFIFSAYLFQKWRNVLYVVQNILLFKALFQRLWVCGPSRDFLVVFCVNDSLFHFSPTRPLAECILGASSITLWFSAYRIFIYYLNSLPFLMLSVVTYDNLNQESLFLCNNSYVWAESEE